MSYVLEMDVSKWIFVERKRREQREGASSKRDISPPPIKQTRPDLAFCPPPYYYYEMVLFFSTTNFALKKTKKNKKKAKELVDV